MLPQQLSYTVSGLYKLRYTEKTLIKKIADLVLPLLATDGHSEQL